jgi:predicted nucleotidyltransferase
METSPAIDLDKVRAFLAGKAATRRERLDRALARAEADFERIVRHISTQYPVTRIWQWGSLVEKRHFSEISDIDIALEGLGGPEEYSAILGDAMRMTDFPLDIIELEKIDLFDSARIRARGRLVYERS